MSPRAPSVRAEADWAVELARGLPAGADACVAVRPMRVPELGRPLYAALSQASALEAVLSLPVEAYVEARRAGRSGPGARVIVLRVGAPHSRVRAALERDAPFAVRWLGLAEESPADAPCTRADCPATVRPGADGSIRIELGSWRVDALPGVEPACLALAVGKPHAVEVAVRQADSLHPGAVAGPNTRHSSVVSGTRDGLVIERVDPMPSQDFAELLSRSGVDLEWAVEHEESVGEELSRATNGAELVRRVLVRWDDLRLATEDRERDACARRYATALAHLGPVDAVPLDDLDALDAQLEALQTLHACSGVQPEAKWLGGLRALLQQAAVKYPNESRFARALEALPR